MSHAADGIAESADQSEQQVTFTIKASNDQKFVLTLPLSTPVSELKAKLATAEYADVPAERIRLIYSGRVLKDADALATYKVVDGNTIHMVKGAQSNARQNPASSSSTAAPVAPAVPQMATGTGNNPLAGLTGARYAGFHGLPNASMFGADGGMGAPPGADDMLRMLDDPNFAQMMNESMNNPAVLQMIESQPMIANNPMLRNMIRNPEMRRMLFSPEMLRAQLQMQRTMGDGQGNAAFPMPGSTDNTATQGSNAAGGQPTPPNPFGGMFGMPPAAGAGQGNPFAALFGPQPTSTTGAASGTTNPTSSPPPSAPSGQQNPTNPAGTEAQNNPFQGLFPGAGQTGGSDPFAMAQQMMQNPDMMRAMFGDGGAFGGGAGGGFGGAGAGAPTGAAPGAEGAAANPFASLFNQGFNPFGATPPQQNPADDRPPEERYAEQLRQLNDMGFFEFDRNVQALRRSGGSVQGAIEHLLNSS